MCSLGYCYVNGRIWEKTDFVQSADLPEVKFIGQLTSFGETMNSQYLPVSEKMFYPSQLYVSEVTVLVS